MAEIRRSDDPGEIRQIQTPYSDLNDTAMDWIAESCQPGNLDGFANFFPADALSQVTASMFKLTLNTLAKNGRKATRDAKKYRKNGSRARKEKKEKAPKTWYEPKYWHKPEGVFYRVHRVQSSSKIQRPRHSPLSAVYAGKSIRQSINAPVFGANKSNAIVRRSPKLPPHHSLSPSQALAYRTAVSKASSKPSIIMATKPCRKSFALRIQEVALQAQVGRGALEAKGVSLQCPRPCYSLNQLANQILSLVPKQTPNTAPLVPGSVEELVYLARSGALIGKADVEAFCGRIVDQVRQEEQILRSQALSEKDAQHYTAFSNQKAELDNFRTAIIARDMALEAANKENQRLREQALNEADAQYRTALSNQAAELTSLRTAIATKDMALEAANNECQRLREQQAATQKDLWVANIRNGILETDLRSALEKANGRLNNEVAFEEDNSSSTDGLGESLEPSASQEPISGPVSSFDVASPTHEARGMSEQWAQLLHAASMDAVPTVPVAGPESPKPVISIGALELALVASAKTSASNTLLLSLQSLALPSKWKKYLLFFFWTFFMYYLVISGAFMTGLQWARGVGSFGGELTTLSKDILLVAPLEPIMDVPAPPTPHVSPAAQVIVEDSNLEGSHASGKLDLNAIFADFLDKREDGTWIPYEQPGGEIIFLLERHHTPRPGQFVVRCHSTVSCWSESLQDSLESLQEMTTEYLEDLWLGLKNAWCTALNGCEPPF